MYRIYRIAETIKVERVVLNALASARAGSDVNPGSPLRHENCASVDFFRSRSIHFHFNSALLNASIISVSIGGCMTLWAAKS
jgi:hypothetical protein